MSEELKPCKRCSVGKGQIIQQIWFEHSGIPFYWVACMNKGCFYETRRWETVEQAVAEWNTRPIKDALRAELDAAKAEVERLREKNRKMCGAIRSYTGLTQDWPGGEIRLCCDSEPGKEHEPDCSFYQWQGGQDE